MDRIPPQSDELNSEEDRKRSRATRRARSDRHYASLKWPPGFNPATDERDPGADPQAFPPPYKGPIDRYITQGATNVEAWAAERGFVWKFPFVHPPQPAVHFWDRYFARRTHILHWALLFISPFAAILLGGALWILTCKGYRHLIGWEKYLANFVEIAVNKRRSPRGMTWQGCERLLGEGSASRFTVNKQFWRRRGCDGAADGRVVKGHLQSLVWSFTFGYLLNFFFALPTSIPHGIFNVLFWLFVIIEVIDLTAHIMNYVRWVFGRRLIPVTRDTWLDIKQTFASETALVLLRDLYRTFLAVILGFQIRAELPDDVAVREHEGHPPQQPQTPPDRTPPNVPHQPHQQQRAQWVPPEVYQDPDMVRFWRQIRPALVDALTPQSPTNAFEDAENREVFYRQDMVQFWNEQDDIGLDNDNGPTPADPRAAAERAADRAMDFLAHARRLNPARYVDALPIPNWRHMQDPIRIEARVAEARESARRASERARDLAREEGHPDQAPVQNVISGSRDEDDRDRSLLLPLPPPLPRGPLFVGEGQNTIHNPALVDPARLAEERDVIRQRLNEQVEIFRERAGGLLSMINAQRRFPLIDESDSEDQSDDQRSDQSTNEEQGPGGDRFEDEDHFVGEAENAQPNLAEIRLDTEDEDIYPNASPVPSQPRSPQLSQQLPVDESEGVDEEVGRSDAASGRSGDSVWSFEMDGR